MQAVAMGLQINETIAEYQSNIDETQKRMDETNAESQRRISQTKVEGVASLQEQSKEAAYASDTAQTQAQMVASGTIAKLGTSGVRSAGSPLLAAQQTAGLAKAQANETTRQGNAGVSYGGLKLGGSLQDISAENTLLTNQMARQITELKRKKKETNDNAGWMVGAAMTADFFGWLGAKSPSAPTYDSAVYPETYST
jgi:hypothetical protein